MIVNELKKSILDYAISGKLTKQNINEKNNIEDDLEVEKDSIMFNIPKNWKWAKVKDISKLIRGNGIKKNEVTNSGIQCIRYGEIYTHYSYSFCKANSFVDIELAEKCQKVKKGDLLITLTGENEYDIAKTTAYLGEDELVAGGDLAILTNHKQNPKYLSYYFASPFAIKQKAKTAKGNIIVHTSTDKIGEYFIPIPPIEEQDRIVRKIEDLFLKLDEIEPLEEELEKIKREFPNEMKKAFLNDVFKEYTEKIELKNISTINGGYAFKSVNYKKDGTGVRVIRISDFDESGIKDDNIVRYDYEPKLDTYEINNNDIIMCMTGGTVGKNVIVRDLKEKSYSNQRVATIKVSENFLPRFIYYFINSPEIQLLINKSKNSTNDNISMDLIKSFKIPNISIKEQEKVIEKIEKVLPLIDNIKEMYN